MKQARVYVIPGFILAGLIAGLLASPRGAEAQPPGNFVEVADKVAESVVNISATQVVRQPLPPGMFPSPESRDFFERFFGPEMDQPLTRQSLGSGVVVDRSGYVLTNYHVIANASEIRVLMKNRKEYPAKVVGADQLTDLAVLKLEGENSWPAATLGDSDAMRVGSWVVAVGSPFGLADSVTAGIISAKDRAIGQGPYDDFIQTDASINPGNSGGPLVNMAGQVIGINTAIFSQTGGNLGIGFAIPSNLAKKVYTDLVKTGRVRRGWLGVTVQPVTPELARQFKLEEVAGALVSAVTEKSPASQAGIRRGDVILRFNNQPVSMPSELSREVAALAPGSRAELTVLRNGQRQSVQVEVGELQQPRPEPQGRGPAPAPATGPGLLGMALSDITPQLGEELNLRDRQGVVVTGVAANSPAALAGLVPGDIIREANQQAIGNVKALEKVMAGLKPGASLLLYVERRGEAHYVVLEWPEKPAPNR